MELLGELGAGLCCTSLVAPAGEKDEPANLALRTSAFPWMTAQRWQIIEQASVTMGHYLANVGQSSMVGQLLWQSRHTQANTML